MQTGLAVFGGAVSADAAEAGKNDPEKGQAQAAPAKLTPESVHYQPTPHTWEKCLYCTYFQAPNACAIVAGTVSPQGWCAHFALAHE